MPLIDLILPDLIIGNYDRKAGHAYIGLDRTDTQTGQVVSKKIGFYPETDWHSTSGWDVQGVWGDDGNTNYDEAISVTVSADQFYNTIDTISNYIWVLENTKILIFGIVIFLSIVIVNSHPREIYFSPLVGDLNFKYPYYQFSGAKPQRFSVWLQSDGMAGVESDFERIKAYSVPCHLILWVCS